MGEEGGEGRGGERRMHGTTDSYADLPGKQP